MALFYNVALAILSALATLAAFGGKTVDDETESKTTLLKRIRPRGWISLGCLALTFGVAVQKYQAEARSQSKASTAARQMQGSLNKANLTIAAQVDKIMSLREDADRQNELLEKQGKLLVAQQASLATANYALGHAQSEARRNLETLLITSLSGQRSVSSASLSFGANAKNAKTIGEILLPSLRQYGDIAYLYITFSPTPQHSGKEVIKYSTPVDNIHDENELDLPGPITRPNIVILPMSENKSLLSFEFFLTGSDIFEGDAGNAYRHIKNKRPILTIEVRLTKQFASYAEHAEFNRTHPELTEYSNMQYMDLSTGTIFVIPKEFVPRVKEDLLRGGNRSVIEVKLVKEQFAHDALSISAEVGSVKADLTDKGSWLTAELLPSSEPMLREGSFDPAGAR